jgi:hypothetical protein
MSTTNPRTIPDLSEFEKNRMLIPEEELKKYDQMWIAVSLDGKRIIAGAPDLLQLDERVQDAGEDPENVSLEFVSFDSDILLGGVELFG